jgi:hypothetical protein
MAAITSAVVGAGLAVKGQQDQKKAQQDAARRSEQTAIQSATLLGQAGELAEQDILLAQQHAEARGAVGEAEAAARLQPFIEPGQEAFRQFQDLTLGGQDIGGPLAESIRQGAMGGVNQRTFDTSGPVGDEIARQSQLAVSGLTPQFLGNLQAAGQQGIAATGDLAGIHSRRLDTLADIAGATAANRASVRVGAGPQLQQLSSGANSARLLGGVAGQQFKTGATESLAQLAGRIT